MLTTVGFVLRGRLKAVRVDARGTESLFRMIERGEQFGMMVGALAEPVPVRVVALEPTTVLEPGLRAGDGVDAPAPGPAPPVADDLRREPAEALLRRRPRAGADDARADPRVPRHPPGGRAAHRPAARGGRETRRVQRLGRVAGPAGRAVPVAPGGRPGAGARGDPPAGGRVAGRQPHHLRRPRGPEAGAGRAADGARRSRGLLRPGGRGRRPRSAACGRSTCRPAAGATRSASPGCWRAAPPVAPAVPDLHDLACRDFKIAEAPPAVALGPVAGRRPGAAGPRPPRRARSAWPSAAGPPAACPTSACSRPSSRTASSWT